MKKNVIGLLLSVVLTMGSVGAVPAFVAETTREDEVAAEEGQNAEEKRNSAEEGDVGEEGQSEEDESFGIETTAETEDADTALTAEEAPEEEIMIPEDEVPAQASEEGAGLESEETADTEISGDEMVDESADTAVTEGGTNPEKEGTESAVDGDISAETAEIGEPLVIEEETEAIEENEPSYGTCGAQAYWTRSGDTVTIYGNGEIEDFLFYVSEEEVWYYVDETRDELDYEEVEHCDSPWWRDTSIKQIIIRNGITRIGSNAFRECSNLTSITIPDSVTSIGEEAFFGCSSLASISLPGVKEIENDAFRGCSSLASINLTMVDSIGSGAFCGCSSLASITLSNKLTEIGGCLFKGCPIKSITIPNRVTWIGSYAFEGCKNLTSIIIPNRVTWIWDHAFEGCKNLTSINIPNSVTNIGEKAFSDCSKLASIDLPRVQSVGKNAFSGCSSLSSITLSNSMEKVGEYSFCDCGVKSITIVNTYLNSAMRIEGHAFENCKNLTSITVPEVVTSIGTYAFNNCSSLASIDLPGVKNIDYSAFNGCSSMASINLPMVESIGRGAFNGCNNLSSIILSDNLTRVGQESFSNCGVKSITIPKNVKWIDDHAFANCKKLTSITIPNSVTGFGDYAFYKCSNLQKITIPDSINVIGPWVFADCNKLTITMSDSITGLESSAFGSTKAVSILFKGTRAQWNNIIGSNEVLYKSIVFSSFSEDASFLISPQSFIHNGKPCEPSITVKCGHQQLINGTDYNLRYVNNTNPGKASAFVTGINKYSGTAQILFEIQPGATEKVNCKNVASGMKVSWEKVSGATRYKVYRYSQLIFTTSALSVTDKDVKYQSGIKYTYTVVASDKNYGDSEYSKSATYYRLMPVGIKSLTNPSAGKMTVTYDKAPRSSGYVVRYGLKSDMSDAKVITVSGAGTLSRTFGNMKKGKTYYVQVRSYKIENGVRYYSGYCTTKKITIKK